MTEDRSQDGPSKDHGGSSQDEPGSSDAAGGAGDAGRKRHEPSHPEDTNERADERARIVEPDGDPSPRA